MQTAHEKILRSKKKTRKLIDKFFETCPEGPDLVVKKLMNVYKQMKQQDLSLCNKFKWLNHMKTKHTKTMLRLDKEGVYLKTMILEEDEELKPIYPEI